jgi:hypothetical protein
MQLQYHVLLRAAFTLQLERLQSLPVIGELVSLPGVRSLLLGVLPGLALRIFVLLLPVILYALNRRAGPVGAAQLDGWVATHFFGLQVRSPNRPCERWCAGMHGLERFV